VGIIFDGEDGLIYDAGSPLLFGDEIDGDGDRVAQAAARIDAAISEARSRGVDVSAAVRAHRDQRAADYAAGAAAARTGGESVYSRASREAFGGSR